jgi:hypothetical protein
MISGWNELKDWISSPSNFNSITSSWSYNLLITGYSFSVFSLIPIGFSLFKTYK